jgi:hypothetical protein
VARVHHNDALTLFFLSFFFTPCFSFLIPTVTRGKKSMAQNAKKNIPVLQEASKRGQVEKRNRPSRREDRVWQ